MLPLWQHFFWQRFQLQIIKFTFGYYFATFFKTYFSRSLYAQLLSLAKAIAVDRSRF